MALQKRPRGIGAIDDIARIHRFPCLGESPERLGIGLDLRGLAAGKVNLNGVHDRLMHAAVIFFGRDAEFSVQLNWKTQCHSHTRMVSKPINMVSNATDQPMGIYSRQCFRKTRSGVASRGQGLPIHMPTDVILADGLRIRPDAVIAATGYRSALEPLVGHLGVLDSSGEPVARAPAQTPGLFFAGFRFGLAALLPYIGPDARAIANAAHP